MRLDMVEAFVLTGTLLVLVLTERINMNQCLIGNAARGIDVSHYQGEIDWPLLPEQNVDFAFIKATEGSSYADECFAYNWEEAENAGIPAGAYHFFSFDSPADSQAELYIRTVGDLKGKMLPVVDVEYYGDKEANPPAEDLVVLPLKRFLLQLEAQYHVKPIVYTTYKVYHKYLEGNISEYPLWIRNVYYPPEDIDRDWTFWQYSDTGTLKGIHGNEQNVDLNVFRGNEAELKTMLIP